MENNPFKIMASQVKQQIKSLTVAIDARKRLLKHFKKEAKNYGK